MADFNITGEAQVGPVKAGIESIRQAIADSRRAIAELSKDSGEGASTIKAQMLIAGEAVKRFANELKIASKQELIDEETAEKFKAEFDQVQYELKRLQSQYKVIAADIAQENAKIKLQVRLIAAEERELYRQKVSEAKKAASEYNKAWEQAIKDDARRNRLVLANAKAIERAHSQAIAEDRRRTAEAIKNSNQIAAAREREASATNLVTSSIKALAVAMTFGQIKNFVNDTVDAAIALDRIKNSLNAATGSVEAGSEAFVYVRKLAYGLGLDLQVLAKQYGLFIAASNDTGISLKQQRAAFEAIAEATRVLGLSNEDMQGSFVALQQILTKGTVQMEELRQQLGDRLPGSLRIMAKALGINQKELYGLTKDGVVPAKEAIAQFSEEVRKALVDPTLGTALSSVQTRFNNLKNVTFELKAAFGSAFGKALAGNLDITQKKLEETKRTASALGEGLGTTAAVILQVVDKVYLVARSVGSVLQGIVFGVAAAINTMVANAANSLSGLADALGLDSLAKNLKDFTASMNQAAQDAVDVTTESFRMSGEQIASALGIGAESAKKLSEQLDRTRLSQEELNIERALSDKAMGLNRQSENGMIDALRAEIEKQRENNAAILAGNELRADAASKMSDEEKAISKMAQEVWKETEAIEGNVLVLTRRGVILQEAIRLAEQSGPVTAAAAEIIKQKVGEQYDAYERLGVAVPKWLQEIGAQYGAVSKAQQAFIDELTAAADKAEKRLTDAMDRRRDSSGEKYGEMDLQDIETQIAEAKKKRDDAVAELLAATDAAGAKKAQKQVEDAEKNIEDRIQRRAEILKKIESQNAAEAKPDSKKKDELQKQADALRADIAALEAKQAGGSLSPEELDRLFAAKDALQDMKNELGSIVETQEQIHFGWSEIEDGTDAATDAWEEYYALVDANAIKAKLALEEQAAAADDIAGSTDGLAVTLTKVGDKWVLFNEAGKAAANEMAISVEKVGDTWVVTNKAAEDVADSTKLAAEQVGVLAVEAKKLEEIKPLQSTAEAAVSAEGAMKRINEDHLPKMIALMGDLAKVSGSVALGGGGAGAGIGYISDVVGQ